ncbi:MAG: aminopeptidase [Syntrophomonadaceae bacterium]|jgi:aspartyl aminopeptidase
MQNGQNLEKNAWTRMQDSDIKAADDLGREYIHFLNQAKTEREAVKFILKQAEAQGFKDIGQFNELKAGEKLIFKEKGKICGLVVIGEEPCENGVNLIASHIDCPRLDLKPRPIYEADGLGLLKTHYYGGIKKYQWVAIPLALHGIVIKTDGTAIELRLGEDKEDGVFTISDLLPHLAQDQMDKKMREAIKGEDLNILAGSKPLPKEDKDPVKKSLLKILHDRFGIEEDDFTSAEIELVPAFPAQEVGFDRSMIGSYGQDDRVSAFTSLKAVLEVEKPKRTAVCLFADKEEIGSTGNTGLQSLILENIMTSILAKAGYTDYYHLRKSLAQTLAISADVNAAVDPNYPEVFEKMNCSFLGNGVVLTKYTGSRGKSGSNDANPEFLARLRKLFADHNITWQVGELGKVDIGGGGTVAQYMAHYGMEVVDCGVAVLGMHSPFEVVSKADVYMAYKAYKAFFGLY